MDLSLEEMDALQLIVREAAIGAGTSNLRRLALALTGLIPDARLDVQPIVDAAGALPRAHDVARRALAPSRLASPDSATHSFTLRHALPDAGLAVVVERAVAAGDFTPRERALFALVAPDLGRAVASVARAPEPALAPDATSGALLWDERGALAHADARGRALCSPAISTALAADVARVASGADLVVERTLVQEGGGWLRARTSSGGAGGARVLTILEPLRPGSDEYLEALAARCGLTPKEREIARLAAEGRSTQEIATALDAAIGTVGTHLSRIYRKCGVAGKPELIRLVLQGP